MHKNADDDTEDLIKQDINFERKSIDFQDSYFGMLKKYQYLLMKESTVNCFSFSFSQHLKLQKTKLFFLLKETRSNS